VTFGDPQPAASKANAIVAVFLRMALRAGLITVAAPLARV